MADLLTDGQRAGRDPMGETLPVTESVELGVRRRLRPLAADTRAALLIAAAVVAAGNAAMREEQQAATLWVGDTTT